MLSELITKAQEADQKAMMELINRFYPLFKKYAVKLNYEDAYEDIVLYYIELIKSLNLKKIDCPKDEIIISYINVSIINFYNKKVRKLIISKREIVFSDLTGEQRYHVEALLAKEDYIDIFAELGIKDLLSLNECQIIYLIYIDGYTSAEIARKSRISRQSVNQLKHRALKKIKEYLNQSKR